MSTAIKHFPIFLEINFTLVEGVGEADLQTELLPIRRAGVTQPDTGQLPLTCRLQKKTVWRHGAFDPWLLRRDSQISTNCGRAEREILRSGISPWKLA